MKRLLASFATAALISTSAFAQTPSPSPSPNPLAGTYLDKTLSGPQRLQLADAVLSTGTDAGSVANAVRYMLMARPVINLLNAFPGFADSIIANPSLSGTITDPGTIGGLYLNAVEFKAACIAAPAARVAYLQPFLSSTLFQPIQVFYAKSDYARAVVAVAQLQFNAGHYSEAIATVAPVLGWNDNDTVYLTFHAKVALRSPDVLSWAKLVYLVQDFQHTQAGIDAVSSAFRALDANLVRANAFIAYQKTGQGTNPLAAVAVPQVTFLGLSPAITAINDEVTGNNVGALEIAVNLFATAPSGPKLNGAVAFVAQCLRNTDCNLVRANAFVTAQAQGQPFTIAELQGN